MDFGIFSIIYYMLMREYYDFNLVIIEKVFKKKKKKKDILSFNTKKWRIISEDIG